MPRGTGVRPRPLLLSNGMERVGMTDLNSTIAAVTERIVKRSAQARTKYLDLIKRGRDAGINRTQLSCGNLAHGFAARGADKHQSEQRRVRQGVVRSGRVPGWTVQQKKQ